MSLQGTGNLSGWQGDAGNLPFVFFFLLKGVPSLAVGYSVVYGGLAIPQADPYLDVYQKIQGSWVFKAEAPVDSKFFGSSFFISPITAGDPGEEWFLTWRKTFGDAGSRLRLRLFALDGANWRTTWSRNELTSGKVSVSKSSIKLSFDKEYHSSLRVFETYEVTPRGVRLRARKVAAYR